MMAKRLPAHERRPVYETVGLGVFGATGLAAPELREPPPNEGFDIAPHPALGLATENSAFAAHLLSVSLEDTC
jgi:hypothetical protein